MNFKAVDRQTKKSQSVLITVAIEVIKDKSAICIELNEFEGIKRS
jgi:hypothetical protein